MPDPRQEHNKQIVDQFTLQAAPFAAVPAHSSGESLRRFVEAVELRSDDDVLDVACGPGILSCAFANIAKRVTGVDLVPAMIEQATERQHRDGLQNVEWRLGDAEKLTFDDESFSLVVTRYSFHHLMDPGAVLREMVRVCRRGGRLAVSDVTPAPDKLQAYDEIETLRDPSHVHALSTDQFIALGNIPALRPLRSVKFDLDIALEKQLQASFPPPGAAERIRELVEEDIGVDRFSIGAHRQNGAIYYSLPISIFVWEKVS